MTQPGLSKRDFLIPLAIIVAGVMVSGSILWSNQKFLEVASLAYNARSAGPESVAQTPPPAATDIAAVSTEGVPFIGSADAPVVMAYWFDYQCPFCKQLETNVMTQLVAEYVATGKVRVLFKDFAFLGPDSQTASLAAHAVWETAPDKFFDWHKAMFEKQDDENAGWGKKEDVIALTKTIPGIDAAKVERLMSERASEYQKAMETAGAEGNAQGVSGTPGVVIGKELIVGSQPYPRFKAVIEAALKAG